MVNPKIILVNAMALGLILFLSMQTTCAACNPSMAIQQKKVATVGNAYSITAQGADGNWFVVPTDCSFTDIGHVLSDGQSGIITAHLFPDILPNKPGVYRFFYKDSIGGEKVPFMATFELE